MKVAVKRWNAVAQWRWDTGNAEQDDDGEGDVCGICRVPYEGCCPSCKMPGEDCPLSTSKTLDADIQCSDIVLALSLGGVYACLPYALLAQMDWDGGFEATMSHGSQILG